MWGAMVSVLSIDDVAWNTRFMSLITGFSCYEQLFHQSGPARRIAHGLASFSDNGRYVARSYD